MENKQNREVESEDEMRPLEFVAVGHHQYGVFNMRTGRFHNPDLGIDIITDSPGRVAEPGNLFQDEAHSQESDAAPRQQ